MTQHVILLFVVPPPAHDDAVGEIARPLSPTPAREESSDEEDLLSNEEGSLEEEAPVARTSVCEGCGKTCSTPHHLRQHMRYKQCGHPSARDSGMLPQHSVASHVCPSCRKTFHTQFHLQTHMLIHTHPNEEYSDGTVTLRLNKYSLERFVRDYKLSSTEPISDVGTFLWSNIGVISQMHASLNNFLVKALLYTRVQYIKINHPTGQVIETVEIIFPSKAADDMTDLEEWLQRHINCINQSIDMFNQRDSGLEFDKVLDFDFKVMLAENRKGMGHFTLPQNLKNKNAVINVESKTHCFKYAVLSMLHYNDIAHRHHSRVSAYRALFSCMHPMRATI